MFSTEIAYLVNKERHKDWLRELEHQRLIQIAEFQQSDNKGWLREAVTWIGSQLMAGVSKMPHHIPAHHQVLLRRR